LNPTAISLALFAATLYASWNAFLKGRADRLWTVTLMSLATFVVALPMLFVFAPPNPASWGFIIASATVQVGYSVLLAQAYQSGGLSDVYPLVRGSAPVFVTLLSYVFVHQHITAQTALGIICICGGVTWIVHERKLSSLASALPALATGLTVAGYVTLDGAGAGISGSPGGYSACIFLLYGLLMPICYLAIRRSIPADIKLKSVATAFLGGLVSLLGYTAMVAALSFGHLGAVSALRETSIVFSAVIGRLILKEPLSRDRLFACATVTLGAVLIGAD